MNRLRESCSNDVHFFQARPAERTKASLMLTPVVEPTPPLYDLPLISSDSPVRHRGLRAFLASTPLRANT
jgi:hypothetical protein